MERGGAQTGGGEKFPLCFAKLKTPDRKQKGGLFALARRAAITFTVGERTNQGGGGECSRAKYDERGLCSSNETSLFWKGGKNMDHSSSREFSI